MKTAVSGMITLRPANASDKVKIFEWLTQSNLTKEMLGPPLFPDNPVPSREEFDADYTEVFFSDSDPMGGRCFVISCGTQEIGQINYNPVHTNLMATELDIWLADEQYSGKGYGIIAIEKLCEILARDIAVERAYIQPSQRNSRAISAYRKAGFQPCFEMPEFMEPDYHDSVCLMRLLK